MMRRKTTHKERIIEALEQLGGHAYLSDIYKVYEELSTDTVVSNSYKADIRNILERNSADSQSFNGKYDLFYSVEGIGNGHWGLREYKDTMERPELTQEDDEFSEGKLLLKKHLQRERNQKLIREAKKKFKQAHGRLYCEVCGFDFQEKYGELGENFIEAHHTKPISTMEDGEKTRIEDIVMVCSNCHSMIHRKKPWLDKKSLNTIIKSS